MRGFFALALVLIVTACGGGSDRPRYSGHEESTAGVPGFSPDGKRKLHPTVKLGQSYTVGGKTYVPRYQPDYDETGMASWYGPGFHGGKTANGEQFSTHQFTAAHTTLPLPSIVRVTYLKTGRSTLVRINDRGPFAHGRIIDLSKAAAQEIGLIRDGVGKVRVQYLAEESERFAELLAGGRDPQSIDLASEVIGRAPESALYANMAREDETVAVTDIAPITPQPLPPIAVVQASPPSVAGPIDTGPNLPPELPPAGQTTPRRAPVVIAPPMPNAPVAPAPAAVESIPTASGTYVQLGAFANMRNAENTKSKVASMGSTAITTGTVGGTMLYRVRMGPFISNDAAVEVLERAHAMGYADAKLVIEH